MSNHEVYDKNHREYVPLSTAYFGHLMIGGGVGLLAFLSYWLLTLWVPAIREDLSQVFQIIVCAVVVSELLVTLLERPHVVKAKKGAPGGALYATWGIVVTPIVIGVVAYLFFNNFWSALALFLIFLTILGTMALWMKPWEPGMTRQDVRDKYNETRQMIREDMLDIDPEHKKLFGRGD